MTRIEWELLRLQRPELKLKMWERLHSFTKENAHAWDPELIVDSIAVWLLTRPEHESSIAAITDIKAP